MASHFDVYAFRPAPPAAWNDLMKDWARELQRTGIVTRSIPDGIHLCDPLSDQLALDAWMPVEFLSVLGEEGGRGIECRREIADQPGVLIVWIDGTVHDGVAPHRLSDLLHLYRVARLELEAFHAAGVRDALHALSAHQCGVQLS